MPAHVMIVLSNTRPESEDEFNDWYTNVHVLDVVNKLDGFRTAQRFRLADGQVEDGADYKYLAIYTIAEGKLAEAQAAIKFQRKERAEALEAGREPWIEARTDLFDGKHRSWFFTAITDEVSGQQ
ncbi:DUF4286 family protein [Nocardioides sp. TF02-7]|uniref:DUF4286 family protein n=1 Tax=Nocardioides sp. TF02-7 TaxID=2917724 RepID=UPI001F051431|nr:DUF4286 family protein [Nocardioides sp. TF02-7]UMG91261.1 hypothetical protein MF408_13865 [Nocardioides sp. TF02-7]